MKTTKSFFREMLSENGVGSSKRLVGSIAMIVALGCIVYLTITEGCTSCVEGLLQVLIITSCSLLGLSSITSVFKGGSVSILPKQKKRKMNKYISISIFRVSGDGKYLDMVFSCPQDYHFTSLIVKVKYFDEYKKEHSASYDLSPAVFTQNDYKYVLQLPLEKLGIKYPAIYEGSFKAEKYMTQNNTISIENSIDVHAGENTFKSIDPDALFYFTNTELVPMEVYLNGIQIVPSGKDDNVYEINLQQNDIIKIISEGNTTLQINQESTANDLQIIETQKLTIDDSAVCSDVSYAYRCMMDDLFMNEGTCEDLIPDSVLRKYLLLYGHTAAMVAGDLDTATEYFKLIGNCFAKCPSKDRGKGSCCSGSCNDKPIRPVHHSCNCGRL